MANPLASNTHILLQLPAILLQFHKQTYFIVLFQLIWLKFKNSKNSICDVIILVLCAYFDRFLIMRPGIVSLCVPPSIKCQQTFLIRNTKQWLNAKKPTIVLQLLRENNHTQYYCGHTQHSMQNHISKSVCCIAQSSKSSFKTGNYVMLHVPTHEFSNNNQAQARICCCSRFSLLDGCQRQIYVVFIRKSLFCVSLNFLNISRN